MFALVYVFEELLSGEVDTLHGASVRNFGVDLAEVLLHLLLLLGGLVLYVDRLLGLFLATETLTLRARGQCESREVLDVVARDRKAILELLVLVDQALFLSRDALLVLDEGLDAFDTTVTVNVEGEGLACGGLHEDLVVIAFFSEFLAITTNIICL